MNVCELKERLEDAGRRAGFSVGYYGSVGGVALPVLERTPGQAAGHLYLSAGVHGDEPAGPMVVLELLRKRLLPDGLACTLLPLVNPTGLERGTRENAQGIDINRDYGAQPHSEEARLHRAWLAERRFDLALCLHEDYETDGFYLYELKPDGQPSRARAILDAVAPVLPLEGRSEIDGMPNQNGLMQPPLDDPDFRNREDMPEAPLLWLRHAPWCYTFETPSQLPIVQRIEAHSRAVCATLKAFF